MNAILNRHSRSLQIAAKLVSLSPLLLVSHSPAHADIYQWEYINPADPSQGKQQSTTRAPDGAGVDAVPGANLSWRNLTMAYLIGADLTGAYADSANLTDADLSQANLTNGNFGGTTLTNADFADAEVRGAYFYRYYDYVANMYVGGFTLAQLYSTASYQDHDLSAIQLSGNNLSGGNFAGQNLNNAYFDNATLTDAVFNGANLANAYFTSATLTDADFTGAHVQRALFNFTSLTFDQLYSTVSYQTHDLSGISLGHNDLTGWNFAGQNLSNVSFYGATLTDADFTDAEVRGARYDKVCGFLSPCLGTGTTLAQLYSTASYQAQDLTGISLAHNDLNGGSFAGQNLTNANFTGAILTDADLTEAEVRGARFDKLVTHSCNFIPCLPIQNLFGTGITPVQCYSTASYQARDLSGISFAYNDLVGGNFTGQNLINANFRGATLTDADFGQGILNNADFTSAKLTGADFSGAVVRGTDLKGTTFYGFTAAQLYSTASYQAHDLTSIGLGANDLTGWNFAGQNLANVNFVNCLGDCYYARLTDADLTAADARGARIVGFQLSSATTTNLIRPDGQISGVDLDAGARLVVRDYDGDPDRIDIYGAPTPIPPIPIKVNQHLTMGPGATLRMVFEADAWDSTIFFAPGIPVALGGTLELTFADEVNLVSQVGRTFDLFDWTGVTPTGTFAISGTYAWDLSNLYTTGELTLTAVPEPDTLILFGVALNSCVLVGRARILSC